MPPFLVAVRQTLRAASADTRRDPWEPLEARQEALVAGVLLVLIALAYAAHLALGLATQAPGAGTWADAKPFIAALSYAVGPWFAITGLLHAKYLSENLIQQCQNHRFLWRFGVSGLLLALPGLLSNGAA